MSLNLLEMAESYLSEAVVGKMSSTLGESTATTTTVLNGALPTILGGLVNKAAEAGGSNLIMNMVTKGNHDGGMLDNLSGVLSDSTQRDAVLENGAGILSGIFGEKTSGVISALASFSGMKEASVSSLMGMAAPMLMGLIGKQATANGLGASGLGSLLASQGSLVGTAMPAGLGALLGNIPGLGALGGLGTGGGLDTLKSSTEASRAKAAATSQQLADAFENPNDGAGLSLGKLLPWLLAALVGVSIWYFTKGCNSQKNNGVAALTDSVAVVNKAANGVGNATANLDSTANATVGKLGAFFKRKLSSGTELTIPENGIENKLITFIEDANKAVDKKTWFDFDRLQFETGKSTLKPTSMEQLTNVVEIMKAYPNVSIKLGGYTDNTGNAKANQMLSAARANSVMAAITEAGISKSRLSAEGYGDQFPVATNATAEGREQNRRVSVRVTKK